MVAAASDHPQVRTLYRIRNSVYILVSRLLDDLAAERRPWPPSHSGTFSGHAWNAPGGQRRRISPTLSCQPQRIDLGCDARLLRWFVDAVAGLALDALALSRLNLRWAGPLYFREWICRLEGDLCIPWGIFAIWIKYRYSSNSRFPDGIRIPAGNVNFARGSAWEVLPEC